MRLKRFLDSLSRYFDAVSQLGLLTMVLLCCANIVARASGSPIIATFDLLGLVSTIVVSFALANCAVKRGNLEIELLVARLPRSIQRIIGIFTNFLSLGLFTLISWRLMAMAFMMYETKEVSMTVQIPFAPFAFGVAIGFILLALVILSDLVKLLLEGQD
jgi:TRAP-type C4-dicarboxylate transport system permease small subunit